MMSGALKVSVCPTVQVENDTGADPRSVATIAAATQRSPAPALMTNPSFQLDAGLGLVVVEFRNDHGVVTTSIPTQQQLEAYRRWETPVPDRRLLAVPTHQPQRRLEWCELLRLPTLLKRSSTCHH
jgi:hypothetical protein